MGAKARQPRKNAKQAIESGDEDELLLREDIFSVDCILHHMDTPDGVRYLIKWLGYEEEKDYTWEPESSFVRGKEDIMARYADDKKREAQGYKEPFDIEGFEIRNPLLSLNPKKTVPLKNSKGQAARKQLTGAPRKKVKNNIFVSSETEDSETEDVITEKSKPSSKEADRAAAGTAVSPARQDTSDTALREKLTTPARQASQDRRDASKKGEQGEIAAAASKKRKESSTKPLMSTVKKTKSLPVAETETAKLAPSMSKAGVEPSVQNLAPSVPPAKPICSVAPAEVTPVSNLDKSKARKLNKQPSDQLKVFSNIDEEAARRPRKLAEGRAYAPSHIKNIVKQKQDGRVPDPKNLVLHDPSELAARPFTHQDKTTALPVMPAIPAAPQEPQTIPETAKMPVVHTEPSPVAHSIPLLCNYFYSNQICPEGDEQCRFLHEVHPGVNLAPLKLHYQAREYEQRPEQWPKFNGTTIVCGFEYRHQEGCYRGYDCAYAHWKPLRSKWRYHDKNMKTCSFWARGICNKSAEQCAFAHEMLDEVAEIDAGSFFAITCPFWFREKYENGQPCNKGEKCKFAHEIRPTIAGNPRKGTPLRPMDPALLQASLEQQATERPGDSPQIVVPPSAIDGNASVATQQRKQNTPTSAVEQLCLEGLNLAMTDVDDITDTVMTTDDDTTSMFMFSILMQMGEVQLEARFSGLHPEAWSALSTCFKEGAYVQPSVSPWDDIEAFIFPSYANKLANGKLAPRGNVREMADLADHLAHEGTGLLVHSKNVIILLFPSRGDLENDDPPPASTIGYQIRTTTEYIDDEEWVEAVEEDQELEMWFQHTFGIGIETLFKWPTNPNTVRKDVFLLLGEDQEAESEALGRYLRWSGIQVYTPEIAGAWNEFKARNEGVVIFDDRIVRYRDIPHLSHLLFCRYNFFELGTNPEAGFLGLTKLFKTGHTIFLTDEVLMQEPDKVIEVVEHIQDKNKSKPLGFETRRIFGRPGLTDWLLKLAEEHLDEHNEGNESRAILWDKVCNLMPIDSPRDSLELIDRVIYEPYWCTTHSEDFDKNPDSATEALLKAFDLTIWQHREHSRYWIVLHPGTEAATAKADIWKDTYCNMRFMTIEDFKLKIIGR